MEKKATLKVIFCLTFPLFLLLFSYQTTLYFADLSPQQENTINYLQAKESLALNYTAKELSHLEDVQEVMGNMDYAFYILLLAVTLILTYYRKNKLQLGRLIFLGGLTTVIFLSLVLLLSVLDFSFVFTIFHQLFFPQGNWIFSPDSLLIRTFPGEFFAWISRAIFLQALVLGSIFIVVGHYLNHARGFRRN